MANDPGQAPQAADTAAEGDDGFTADERAQFAEMEQETAAPPVDGAPPEPPADAGKVAPAAGAASAGDAEDDDDDAGDDAAPAAGAGGAPAAGGAGEAGAGEVKPKKRVSARKYERTAAELADARKEAQTLRESMARADERMKIINDALTPPPVAAKAEGEEDPEPDAEKDVFAWIAWSKRDRARTNDRLTEIQSGRQAETQDAQLANTYTDDARSFASTEPNFVPAYQFLMANRTYELAQYFFGKDLQEPGVQLLPAEVAKIKTTIGNEEKQLVSEAVKAEKSPAARIFALAKARGFRPPGAGNSAAKPNGAAKPAGNGAAAAAPGSLAEGGGAAASRVEDEIARIREGSESSRSLSHGGGAPPSPMTPEKLANMPQDEFDRFVDSLSPAQERAMFGDAP